MATNLVDLTYDPRAWRCEECGALLGWVLRDVNRVRKLWLLRVQHDACRVDLSAKEVLAAAQLARHNRYGMWRVRGMDAAGGVCCDLCGSIQEWHASQEALYDLLRKTRMGETAVKEFKKLMRGKK